MLSCIYPVASNCCIILPGSDLPSYVCCFSQWCTAHCQITNNIRSAHHRIQCCLYCFTFASWFLVIYSYKQIILYVYFFNAFISYSFFKTLFTQCLKSLLNAWDRLWQYETLKISLIENRRLLCMPNMIVYNSPKSKERHESTSNSWQIKVKCVI